MGKVPRPNIVWRGAHPNNFMVGREGRSTDRNTFHHVVGSAESAVLVFQDGARGASSSLVITDRPDIAAFMCVDFANTSFCDANWDSNLRSITMEHHGDWRNGYNNPQVLENSAQVVAWLRDQGLVSGYVRHRDVSRTPTECSGDLPVETIWNRATEIINYYNNVDNRPDWMKQRTKTDPFTVYAQKDSIYLYNLETGEPYDARRWGINQSFEIGSTTVVNARRYYITKSSTEGNAPAGLDASEVDDRLWAPPIQWNPTTPRQMITNKETRVLNLDTMEVSGSAIPVGVPIDVLTTAEYKGRTYYRSKYATEKGFNTGIDSGSLDEKHAPAPTPPIIIVPAPQPTSPEWVDAIIDEPNRPMYVLRATPLIDLENGRTYIDPKTNKEVWFQAGDIVEQVSAHVVIAEKTYRLTEFAYSQVMKGEWQKWANGIDSNQLTTDPKACPAGTPANPTPAPQPDDDPADMPDVPTVPTQPPVNPPSSGSQYMEELLKQNNGLLKQIFALLESIWNKLTGK